MLSVKGAGGGGLEIKNGGSVDITALSDEIDVGNFVSCSSGGCEMTPLLQGIVPYSYSNTAFTYNAISALDEDNKYITYSQHYDGNYTRLQINSVEEAQIVIIKYVDLNLSPTELTPRFIPLGSNKFLLLTVIQGKGSSTVSIPGVYGRVVQVDSEYNITFSEHRIIYQHTGDITFSGIGCDTPFIKLDDNEFILVYKISIGSISSGQYSRMRLARLTINDSDFSVNNDCLILTDNYSSQDRKPNRTYDHILGYLDTNGALYICTNADGYSISTTYKSGTWGVPHIYKISCIENEQPVVELIYASSSEKMANGFLLNNTFCIYDSHVGLDAVDNGSTYNSKLTYYIENDEVKKRIYPCNNFDDGDFYIGSIGYDRCGGAFAIGHKATSGTSLAFGIMRFRCEHGVLLYEKPIYHTDKTYVSDLRTNLEYRTYNMNICLSNNLILAPVALDYSTSNSLKGLLISTNGETLKATKYTDDEPCYGIVTKKITSTSGTIAVPTID